MPRTLKIILATTLVALSVLNVAVFVSARGARGMGDRPGSLGERWRALPAAQRLEYVRQYQALGRQPNGAAVLRRAREFGRRPAEEQERWRALQRIVQETLDRQPVAGRRELLRSPPRARAYFVYRELVAELPDWLTQLSASRAQPPDESDQPVPPADAQGADDETDRQP